VAASGAEVGQSAQRVGNKEGRKLRLLASRRAARAPVPNERADDQASRRFGTSFAERGAPRKRGASFIIDFGFKYGRLLTRFFTAVVLQRMSNLELVRERCAGFNNVAGLEDCWLRSAKAFFKWTVEAVASLPDQVAP
jgi:hypothetical protein